MPVDDIALIREAADAGLRSLEPLVLQLSRHQPPSEFRDIAEQTIAEFKNAISVMKRTGHARFRRGPQPGAAIFSDPPSTAPPPAAAAPPTVTLDFTKPKKSLSVTDTAPVSNSSFLSGLSGGEGSVTGKSSYSSVLVPSTGGRPPLARSHHRKDPHGHPHSVGAGPCHCAKKRYARRRAAHVSPFPHPFSKFRQFSAYFSKRNRDKKTVRVPAMSSRSAEIPADEHSWRKYGQKLIKGSPYSRCLNSVYPPYDQERRLRGSI